MVSPLTFLVAVDTLTPFHCDVEHVAESRVLNTVDIRRNPKEDIHDRVREAGY